MKAIIQKPNFHACTKKVTRTKGCGRSLVWLGHQPATLTTRVQIPATAPSKSLLIEHSSFHVKKTSLFLGYSEYLFWLHKFDIILLQI